MADARDAAIAVFDKMIAKGVSRQRAAEEAAERYLASFPASDLNAEDSAERLKGFLLSGRQQARPATPSQQVKAAAPAGTSRAGLPEGPRVSPFRFVSLNDVVVPPDDAVLGGTLDTPLKGGFCGTLEVEWIAETPLLIGQPEAGREEVVVPVSLGGKWIIPGSTLRGCLRAAVEIVASARLQQINGWHRYGLRDFDHPLFRRREGGDEISLLSEVEAGWLYRTESGYEIRTCKKWFTIAIADLPFRNYEDGYLWREKWLRTSLVDRYRASVGLPPVTAEHKPPIDFGELPERKFTMAPEGSVGQLRPDPNGKITGHLVFSNRSPSAPNAAEIERKEHRKEPGQPKKREYVFVDDPDTELISVPNDDWDRFLLINSKPSRNARQPDGSWAVLAPSLDLPNGRIPVFFIRTGDKESRLDLGLTRFFKVAHRFSVANIRDRTVAHCRARVPRNSAFPRDLVEMLFGYVYEPTEVFDDAENIDPASIPPNTVARKARIAVGIAKLESTQAVVYPRMASSSERGEAPITTVMSAPRASFAPFYLAGPLKDYSADSASLAGRKRYFPRFDTVGGNARNAEERAAIPRSIKTVLEQQAADATDSLKLHSHLRLLTPSTAGGELVFRGEIRLHNVTAVEIGALLWALTFGGDPTKPYRHMLGRAKGAGAGQMRIGELHLDLQPNDAEPRDGVGPSLLQPAESWEIRDGDAGWLTKGNSLAPFLRAFHSHMQGHRKTWPNVRDIVEFLNASSPARGAALAKPVNMLRYPKLQSGNEFQQLRQKSKLSSKYTAPQKGIEPDRYLAVMTDIEVKNYREIFLPYLGDSQK